MYKEEIHPIGNDLFLVVQVHLLTLIKRYFFQFWRSFICYTRMFNLCRNIPYLLRFLRTRPSFDKLIFLRETYSVIFKSILLQHNRFHFMIKKISLYIFKKITASNSKITELHHIQPLWTHMKKLCVLILLTFMRIFCYKIFKHHIYLCIFYSIHEIVLLRWCRD